MLTRDLRGVAPQAMIDEGFDPDPDPAEQAELQNLGKHHDGGALLSTNPKLGFIDFGRVGDTPTPNPPGKR